MTTLRPWQVDHTTLRIEPLNAPRYDLNDGWKICECLGPEAEANAAHIVHCVNTYPVLVKALEATLQALRHAPIEGCYGKDARYKAEIALALARKVGDE